MIKIEKNGYTLVYKDECSPEWIKKTSELIHENINPIDVDDIYNRSNTEMDNWLRTGKWENHPYDESIEDFTTQAIINKI